MNIEEYEKIQEKIILIIERYKFFEKNEISKINFDIEDCSVFKECIMSLRYLIQEDKKEPIMENKQYKILKKYFLNFNEKDFKVLNYDIHSYINYDNNEDIIINGKTLKDMNRYVLKNNYYFFMGDNRDSSYDSRFWGFVPDTQILGTPLFALINLFKFKLRLTVIS